MVPQPSDEPGKIDLTVNVVERRTGGFSAGGGMSRRSPRRVTTHVDAEVCAEARSPRLVRRATRNAELRYDEAVRPTQVGEPQEPRLALDALRLGRKVPSR